MAKIYRPSVIHERTILNTVGGEVTINLNLTIRVEGDSISVSTEGSSAAVNQSAPPPIEIPREDKFQFVIPDFDSIGLIDFGKEVGKEENDDE